MRRRDFFRRTQQRHYTSHSRENPYFRGQGRAKRLHVFLLPSFCCLVVLIILSFLFAHSAFDLTTVYIKGAQHIDRNVLSSAIKTFMGQRRLLFFHEQNHFLFDEEAFIHFLYTQFTFRDIQIERKGNHLDISVVERTSQLIWSSASTFSVVDLDGVIIRALKEDEVEQFKSIGMPLFVDRNDVEVQIGQHVLTPEEIDAVFRFHEHLRVQHIEFTQTEFDRLAGKWVGVLTKQDYRILFDTTTDIDAQAQRLEVVLKDKVKDSTTLEYIDLRFGDHVYFK